MLYVLLLMVCSLNSEADPRRTRLLNQIIGGETRVGSKHCCAKASCVFRLFEQIETLHRKQDLGKVDQQAYESILCADENQKQLFTVRAYISIKLKQYDVALVDIRSALVHGEDVDLRFIQKQLEQIIFTKADELPQ